MSKNKRRNKLCQQKLGAFFREHGFTKNTLDALLSDSRSDKQKTIIKIMKFLYNVSFRGAVVRPRQITIGRFADITREYANTLLHELEGKGVVLIINRGYDTCHYELHPDFFGANRFEFADYFPVIKTLTLGLLMCLNPTSLSSNKRVLTPILSIGQERYKIDKSIGKNLNKDSYAMKIIHDQTGILDANTPERIMMHTFKQIERTIANRYKFTLYATILITGFDTVTLEKAFKQTEAFLMEEGDPGCVFSLLYSYCKKIYNMEDKQINWVDVKHRLDAANCHKGMPLFRSDVEAQPDYDRPKNIQQIKYAGARAQPVEQAPPCSVDSTPASLDPQLLAAMDKFKARLDRQ